MPHFHPQRRGVTSVAVLIALLAPVLGGATEVWSQGTVLALLGIGVLAAAPGWAPHRFAGWAVACALALAALAFLPARWLTRAPVPAGLGSALGIDLPASLSPQPLLSLEGGALLAAGLVWWWWSATALGPTEARERVARWVAVGVIALAGVALAEFAGAVAIPWWPEFGQFGPFPNRNQMGDLLGTWAIVAGACGVAAARRRRWTCGVWFAGIGVLLWAIMATTSRAGLAIFFAGLAAWGLRESVASRQLGKVAIALGAGLCAAALFFAFGGEAFQRFLRLAAGTGGPDFRHPIARDALAMIRDVPWCGIGLGNFDAVFAFFRAASAAVPIRVIHPESDWLWLTAEMGWLAPALVPALVAPSLWHRAAIRRRHASPILRATLLGGVLFLLHGLVDVSGHRLGSALPGILLLALSAGPSARDTRRSPATSWTFRAAGAGLLAVGILWLGESRGVWSLPGGVAVEAAKTRGSDANEREDFAAALRESGAALAWAPLDAELHFIHAVAAAYTGEKAIALRDFRRARRLEPSDPAGPFEEGSMWAQSDPGECREAWTEALRRAGAGAPGLYRQMLSVAQSQPGARLVLRQLAGGDPDRLLPYLDTASAMEFVGEMQQSLARDPHLASLSPEQQRQLFTVWLRVGDRAGLAAFLETHPQLADESWPVVAELRAQQRDFRGAVEWSLAHLPAPPLPIVAESSLDTARRAFFQDPGNAAAGYQTFRAEQRAGDLRAAAGTLEKLSRLPQPPAYVPYLRARVLAELGDWEAAWREAQRASR